jgi:hypothetical protein
VTADYLKAYSITEEERPKMNNDDLNATFEIRGGFQGGAEPWSQTTTLMLDAAGFHDSEGIGRSGDDPEAVLSAARVSEMLLETFDRKALCAILDHLVALRDTLEG